MDFEFLTIEELELIKKYFTEFLKYSTSHNVTTAIHVYAGLSQQIERIEDKIDQIRAAE